MFLNMDISKTKFYHVNMDNKHVLKNNPYIS